ncbi:hypothetical protein K2173_001521 [Erythroxylum novogranatense]|uniref:Gnk2-homologous domain-containing protein n=1 Tax=Erythroxylum novogranatense TaxID=1862640 RepID=A0AAV8T570_9ROSI|nr:hypothetical protein K2173_001521 [Erythroxylum novogranatense]
MSFSRMLIFFFSRLIVLITAKSSLPPLYFCLDKGYFSNDSTYESNLNGLLSTLSSNPEINHTGFCSTSLGQNDDDTVNAIALCRRDITTKECISCIDVATRVFPEICPNQKESILWYDICMLRFSNRSISRKMEIDPSMGFFNNISVPESERTQFYTALSELMDNLASRVKFADSRHNFAAGNVSLGSNKALYVMVQCTPDLAGERCSDCLFLAYDYIISYGSTGGKVFAPSCQLRYEMYLFFEPDALDMSEPPQVRPTPPISPTISTSSPPTRTSGTIGNVKKLNILFSLFM